MSTLQSMVKLIKADLKQNTINCELKSAEATGAITDDDYKDDIDDLNHDSKRSELPGSPAAAEVPQHPEPPGEYKADHDQTAIHEALASPPHNTTSHQSDPALTTPPPLKRKHSVPPPRPQKTTFFRNE